MGFVIFSEINFILLDFKKNDKLIKKHYEGLA